MDQQRTSAQRRAEAAERAQLRAQRRDGPAPPVSSEVLGDDPSPRSASRPEHQAAPESGGPPPQAQAPAAVPGPEAFPARRRGAGAPVAAASVQRRRFQAGIGLVVVLALIVWVAGLGGGDENKAGAAADAAPQSSRPELPGGGRRIFPDRRVVAFAGNPRDEGLGALGVGKASTMLAKLARQAKPYARASRPVLPALELITSIATADPGVKGDHVIRADAATIDRYLRLARRSDSLLLLDVQPGFVDFPRELNRLRPWLKEPDVGLAIDPEWRVEPGQLPGQVIGSVSAPEVNATSAALAAIVKQYDLPEKLFVVHQFTDGMVRDPGLLVKRRGLATVFNVDGVGRRANKVAKYTSLAADKPGYWHGFKLFYEEDTGLMPAKSVMAMTPRPDLIVYE